ncbi:MAG: hypothetical protein KatS3mg097_532 [Candidatus Parcubacteria bacterium]|nr:MAG: hypothetical protein KatS3mg097_532 [Candidatus Parcubacteria bacterium]
MKKFLYLGIAFSFLLLPTVFANVENAYANPYIKDFEAKIIVNKDSSLFITEKIAVYFGDSFDKGILLRELPTQIKVEQGVIKTPVELLIVTDFDTRILYYKEDYDNLNHVKILKIENPNKTTNGVKYYKIYYLVKNAIVSQNSEFDKLYWNLNGYFGDLMIENFKAVITFPKEINSHNTKVDYYIDYFNFKDKNLVKYRWLDNNILEFTSSAIPQKGKSIIVSLTLPKGIFASRQISFFEKYNDYLNYLSFSIPLVTLILCFYWWLKYGKDPIVRKPVVPEYEPPEGLSPLEMGVLIMNGRFTPELLAAGIMYLAGNGLITITRLEQSLLGIPATDYKIKKTELGKQKSNIDISDQKNILPEFVLLAKLPDEFLISSLKHKFNKEFIDIQNYIHNSLIKKNIFTSEGLRLVNFCFSMVFVLFLLGILSTFISLVLDEVLFTMMIFASAFIFFLFGLIMSKVTPKGAEILWRIKGFELYLETAEQYRQQFYEQENVFDKFLPYAMVFGIAHSWVRTISELYEKSPGTTDPLWYRKFYDNTSNVNVDEFISTLNNTSLSVASIVDINKSDSNADRNVGDKKGKDSEVKM